MSNKMDSSPTKWLLCIMVLKEGMVSAKTVRKYCFLCILQTSARKTLCPELRLAGRISLCSGLRSGLSKPSEPTEVKILPDRHYWGNRVDHCSEAGKISVCLPATFVKSVRRVNVSLHRYQTEDQATSKKEEKKSHWPVQNNPKSFGNALYRHRRTQQAG